MSKTAPHPDTGDAASAEPTANERGEHARTWIGWSCAVLGLPLIYVLSCGPAVWVTAKFNLNPAFFETTYRPLDWAYNNTPLKAPLRWYVEFWYPG